MNFSTLQLLEIVFSDFFSSLIFSPFILPHVIEENTEFSVFFSWSQLLMQGFFVYQKAS